MSGALSPYPFGIKEGPTGTSLAMHPLVDFPKPSPAAFRKSVAEFSFDFLLKIVSKNTVFGRSLAQLILAALSLCLYEVKKSPERRFLSDAPFVLNGFCCVFWP